MMTESCLNMNTCKPCQDLSFASYPIWNQRQIHIASSTHQWNIGRRISDDIERDVLPLFKITLGASVGTTTESTSSPSRPLNSLVSPPSSVGSKRHRSASSPQIDAVGKRVSTKEVNEDLKDL